MKSYLFTILAAEYFLQMIPKGITNFHQIELFFKHTLSILGTHDWNKYITPDELTQLLQSNDMTVQSKNGIILKINPKQIISRNVFHLSDNDLEVNYIVHSIKPNK